MGPWVGVTVAPTILPRGPKGGGGGRPSSGGGGGSGARVRHRNDFLPHHIYCAESKVKWGGGGGWPLLTHISVWFKSTFYRQFIINKRERDVVP